MEKSQVYTVQQFCDVHQVGRNLFYKMIASGRGPAIMKIGRRTLISRDAAAAWREKIEMQTAGKLAECSSMTGWVNGGHK